MQERTEARHISLRRMFVAAAGGTCIANAAWWMQPLLMHDLSETRHFGAFAGGMILTVEMATMALTSVFSARLLVGWSLRMLALVGLALAVVGSLIAYLTQDYSLLLGGRALAGCGAGLGLMMMNAAAATFPDPDRVFARLSVISILFGMAIVAAMPLLGEGGDGRSAPFAMILLALALTGPLVSFLPSSLRVKAPEAGSDGNADGAAFRGKTIRSIMLLSFITFAIGCASGVMWVFYAMIGQQAGLSLAGIDGAISMAIFAALFAAGAAALIGSRFGRALPVGAGLLILVASVMVLSHEPGALAFRLATMGNVGAIYFLIPYLFGAAASLDASGRGAVYVGSAFYLTGAVGPVVGGYLAMTVGMGAMGMTTLVVAIVSFVIMRYIDRTTSAHEPDLSHEGPVVAQHVEN